jgi:hypothetical protein
MTTEEQKQCREQVSALLGIIAPTARCRVFEEDMSDDAPPIWQIEVRGRNRTVQMDADVWLSNRSNGDVWREAVADLVATL